MMATPHMMAGAAIGRALRRPWLAYPAALASHFVLDIVPHLDSHGMFGATHGGPTRLEAIAGISDFLVGALLVGLVASRQRRRRVMVVGGLLGILVDLVEYVPPLGPWLQSWSGAEDLIRFHHGIQHNVTVAQWPLGFATQGVVLAIALALCLRRDRTGRTAEGGKRASATNGSSVR